MQKSKIGLLVTKFKSLRKTQEPLADDFHSNTSQSWYWCTLADEQRHRRAFLVGSAHHDLARQLRPALIEIRGLRSHVAIHRRAVRCSSDGRSHRQGKATAEGTDRVKYKVRKYVRSNQSLAPSRRLPTYRRRVSRRAGPASLRGRD